ncbi:611_t:CDS:1, partial [Acaulospora colombiana]
IPGGSAQDPVGMPSNERPKRPLGDRKIGGQQPSPPSTLNNQQPLPQQPPQPHQNAGHSIEQAPPGSIGCPPT